MPSTVSTADFWKQLVASRLITETAAQNLEEKFVELKGEAQGNTVTLAQWLIAENVLSRYQAKVLLAGRVGPFVYGDYTVYDRHSEGRLQGTFRANHPGTRHRVLLYFHTGPVVQNEKLWSALVDEIAKLSKAIHPHVVRVYQLCDLGQFKFTVMDDLQGESAEERVTKSPLPAAVACRMVRQASQGAARLLQLGQLHGAIRPGNVWIDKQGNAQLLLPPLARNPLAVPKPIDLVAADTSGEQLCQADYLAPELAQPKQAPGPQTEVYALGCTLFNLLTGRLPFSGGDLKSKLASHSSEPIPTLDAAAVPAPIAQVLAFSLAKDPAKRFRDPTQLADTLGKLLEKIDRTQLRWPPSLPPTRLPEYESWLHPYGVRPEEAGRASPMNVLWSKEDEHFEPPRIQQPVAVAEARRSAVQEVPREMSGAAAKSVPAEVDSPLDWMGADPRRPRKAQQKHASSKLAVIITTALVLLCLVGAVVTWIVLSNRSNGGRSADGGAAKSTTQTSPNSPDATSMAGNEDRSNQRNGESHSAATRATVGNAPSNDENRLADAGPGGDSEVQSDSGLPQPTAETTSLWISPTQGSPLTLAHVGPGLQAALILRPDDLLRLPDGEKVLAAIGPDAESARHELESIIGAALAEVEQLTIAWVESMTPGTNDLSPIFIIRFQNAPDQQKLTSKWKKQDTTGAGGQSLFQTPQGLAAFWPTDEAGKVLVLGSTEQVEEAAKLASSPPLLRREVERLLAATDNDRLATLLFVPSAVPTENGESPANPWQMLLGPGKSFFGDEVRAAALSAHLEKDDLFLELRIQGPLDRPAAIVAQAFRERLAKLANAVEGYIAALNLSPYGKRILLRYPQMIKLLDEFTRSGVEGNQAVLRCYLPAAAAHNLLMGTELALAEGASQSSLADAGGPGQNGGAKPADTVQQKLKRVTSLNFNRDTLERAIQLLADDIGVKAEILGPDLQLEGITKNQSFGLDEKDKAADEILRDIMLKANPDGKLVYVVKSKEPGGEEMLLITTRAAATKRGDKLPAELAAPPKKK